MKSVTVAGIDCGTNSIRLKVSRVDENGVEDIVPRILRVIRLGQDVDKTHRFADEALERWDVEAPYLVVDLGGGSTELVLGGDGVTKPVTQVQAAFSMNIGSVRMTERHLRNDPPTEAQIDEAIQDIDEHIDEAFRTVPAGKARTIIGVSGTVTTMTALSVGLTEYDHSVVDGARCTLEDAFAVDDRFLRMPREERLTYKTIHPGRVDVVGGGALVWSRVLARVSEAAQADHGQAIDSFMASEHGLLDGIVLDYGTRLLAAR